MINLETYGPEPISLYSAVHAKSIVSSWDEETGHKKVCLFQTPNGHDLVLIVIKNEVAMRIGLSLDEMVNMLLTTVKEKWPIDIEEAKRGINAPVD